MEIKAETLNVYLFEFVERICRYYLHLEDVKIEFYLRDNSNDSNIKDKLNFLESYTECLTKLIELAVSIRKLMKIDNTKNNEIANLIKQGIQCLANLHEKLNHLPRPTEPITLKRFSRIIKKHIINLEQDKQISIYSSENIGDSAYASDPLKDFKNQELSEIIDVFNKIVNGEQSHKKIEYLNENPKNIFHITIPRIDATNPCRWPTLIHEVAHHVMDESFFNDKDILSNFNEYIEGNENFEEQKKVLDRIANNNISLNHWLTECWCDLFATVVMGPSFWFSQYEAFIFEGNFNKSRTHPPALFRMNLIYKILSHRLKGTLFNELKDNIKQIEMVFEYFDYQNIDNFNNNDDIRELFLYFKDFYFRHFFTIKNSQLTLDSDSLNKKIEPLIKYSNNIKGDVINKLVDSLKENFPIASKRINEITLKEEPTYLQESLLAGWIYRNSIFKVKILEALDKFEYNEQNDFFNMLDNEIIILFKRFDDSILRSIQVSEWFDLLNKDNSNSIDYTKLDQKSTRNNIYSILVDYEIYGLLKSKKIIITPLINVPDQLGSTSFDIRLGTSFQIFYPNRFGIINTNENFVVPENDNSKSIDLDWLESITITPGQFILGHSMEYIQLPNNISAEVEGRSSFARLGLEIHMTAGFIDPGYSGVITFEIFNAGPNPILLYPGTRIAQLRFFSINEPVKDYSKKSTAKYKSLLRHHNSLLVQDSEMELINKEIKELKNNK